MTDARDTAIRDLIEWLIERGAKNAGPEELLCGYGERLMAAGVPVSRVQIAQPLLNAQFGATTQRWREEDGYYAERFARRDDASTTEAWRQSPFYHLLNVAEEDIRFPVTDADPPRFPVFAEFHKAGYRDYYALRSWSGDRPPPRDAVERTPHGGLVMSFLTRAPDGFAPRDLADIRHVHPALVLALRSYMAQEASRDLLAAYLGPDAGARVLSGELHRGSMQTTRAVVLMFDLRRFTELSETLPGPEIIAMLNAYFGAIVPAIEAHGGNVLKFLGDGLLAIFPIDRTGLTATLAALDAIQAIRREIAGLEAARAEAGLVRTDHYMALHAGDVFYGNIGAPGRLDFTAIGAAVNTAARILGMCGPLGQTVVISAEVARPALDRRGALVSLGAYRLRGVRDRQELFTLDPET